MFNSRELSEVLLARPRRKLWFRGESIEVPPGRFPPAWEAWFATMTQQVGAVKGATADAILAILVRRELVKPPPASSDLSRWGVFCALWRQRWHPASEELPRDRIAGYTVSIAVHLVLLMLLLFSGFRHLPSPAQEGDESVVQVEFIGEGTPEETGGGAPQAPTVVELPQAGAAPRPDAAAPAVEPPSVAAAEPAPAAPSEPAPQPQPHPEPPAQQPLQVTETTQPDTAFVLPPTTVPQLRPAPQPDAPRMVVQTIERNVELAEAPQVPVVRMPTVTPATAPSVQARARATQVQSREVPLLTRPQAVPQVAQRSSDAPRINAPAREVQGREVPLAAASTGEQRTPQPAEGSAPAAANRSSGAAPAAAAATGAPNRSAGERAAQTEGRGASPNAPPGAWPTPQRGDDWGASTRNRPGGNPGAGNGLFNADGSPRLPPGAAAAGGGFPPGSDNWSRALLDRNGTWATRPPLGYEPTRFDEYWIPSGTLLQEWVRRGMKNLAIPIPGTSKKINCVISVLQLGGGCGISDDNLQDQEAVARPPPDIPYKPELQEGGP